MYALFGFASQVKSIYTLVRSASLRLIESVRDLSAELTNFLIGYQPEAPKLTDATLFVDDLEMETRLASLFKADSSLNDFGQSVVVGDSLVDTERAHRVELVRAALVHVKHLDVSIHRLFLLAINAIFFRASQRAVGGSTSTAVGAIWFAGRPRLNFLDYAELLVHELTHNLLFLDEIRYGHFNYELIKDPANFALSSILKMRPPLDKVIHSIVVAHEVLVARHNFLGCPAQVSAHPPQKVLHAQALAAIDSVFALANLSQLVRPRMVAIVKACQRAVTAMPLQRVG